MNIPQHMIENYNRARQAMKEIEAIAGIGQQAFDNDYNQVTNQRLNGLSNEKCDAGQNTACANGKERTVLETMLITSDRLERVTNRLWNIHALIFGSEPSDCVDPRCGYETSVKSQAGRAFTSSNDLERLCDDIYSRITFE